MDLTVSDYHGPLPLAMHTDFRKFVTALQGAINSQSLDALKSVLSTPLRFFGTPLSGASIDEKIRTFVFACVRSYGGWSFAVEGLGHGELGEGPYWVPAREQNSFRRPDNEGRYVSLWTLRKVSGYWRVVEVGSIE